jgi:hypothetical protein
VLVAALPSQKGIGIVCANLETKKSLKFARLFDMALKGQTSDLVDDCWLFYFETPTILNARGKDKWSILQIRASVYPTGVPFVYSPKRTDERPNVGRVYES